MILAHLSDIHVSRYGEHVTSLRGKRLRTPLGKPDPEWETVLTLDGWRIERRARKRWRNKSETNGFQLRLLDEEGYVQQKCKVSAEDEGRARAALSELVSRRESTEHVQLAASFPSASDVERALSTDPENTNLLLHRAVRVLREDRPDWVLVSGDLTDDGVGYDLLVSWLGPWAEKGRLLAIPGNHDTYDSPAFVVPSHERRSRLQKRLLWGEFALKIGLPTSAPWIRELGEGALVCGLDSCIPPRAPLSASGEVDSDALLALEADLEPLSNISCRLAMLHHHVVNPPIRGFGRAPWQIGMRLRNAAEVFESLRRLRFTCILNGHRHVGYRYQPAHAPLYVSAPSATLGCRSGAAPFYWRIEIESGEIRSVRERPFQM